MSKRKANRPRQRAASPLIYLQPCSEANRAKQETMFLSALESMTTGKNPSTQDWRTLADAINIVETLAVDGKKLLTADVIPVCETAAEALVQAVNRSEQGKPLRLSGIGLQACRDVIAVYLQAMELLTQAEFNHAVKRTVERLMEAVRTNDPALIRA